MCCRTNSYCCTHDMRKGIMIAGIIDLILLVIILIFNVAVTKNLLALWFVIVIVADVLLIIGSMNANSGLLMVWMIIEMINIVFLFIGWLAMPIYAFVVIFAASVCNSTELNFDCGGKETGVLAYFIMNMVFIIGLPIYYIYLWVVVKSHRENLVGSQTAIQPIQGWYLLYVHF